MLVCFVDSDFHHQLRFDGQVADRFTLAEGARPGGGQRVAPRVGVGAGEELGEVGLLAACEGDGAADVVQPPAVGVAAEQKHHRAGGGAEHSPDQRFCCGSAFPLPPAPQFRPVPAGEVFDHQTLAAGGVVAVEPGAGFVGVAGGWAQVDAGRTVSEEFFQQHAAFEKRPVHEVVAVDFEEVKNNERARMGVCLGRQASARSHSTLKGGERGAASGVVPDDEFAVEDHVGQQGGRWVGGDVWEVAVQWFELSRLHVDVVAAGEGNASPPVHF